MKKKPHAVAAAKVAPTLTERESNSLRGLFQAMGLAQHSEDLNQVIGAAAEIVEKWGQHPDRINNLMSLFHKGILRNLEILREEEGLGDQIAQLLLDHLEMRLGSKPNLNRFLTFVRSLRPIKIDPTEARASNNTELTQAASA